MDKLWKQALSLFRSHPVLWAPCSIAGIAVLLLDKLQKTTIHWVFRLFSTQKSVLGGTSASVDPSVVQHRVMMVDYPIGTLKDLLEIFLFVAALFITGALVRVVLDGGQTFDLKCTWKFAPHIPEGLWLSIKYLVVMGALGAIMAMIASLPVNPEALRQILSSKIFIYVFSLAWQSGLAWLLVPSAIRLLREPRSSLVSAEDRRIGTVFVVTASVAALVLEFLIDRAEGTVRLTSQPEKWAVAVFNTVVLNLPEVVLFIALALLAIQDKPEEATPTEGLQPVS